MYENEKAIVELTLSPRLRQLVLSVDPAILFDAGFKSVLWANASGLRFFGGEGLSRLLAMSIGPGHPLVRQFRLAAAQIGPNGSVVRGFRVSQAGRTRFIQCELSSLSFSGGASGTLVTCGDERFRLDLADHHLARRAVEAFAGVAANLAIIDYYGLVLAADNAFADIGLDDHALESLAESARGSADGSGSATLSGVTGDVVLDAAKLDGAGSRFLVHATHSGDAGGERAGAGTVFEPAADAPREPPADDFAEAANSANTAAQEQTESTREEAEADTGLIQESTSSEPGETTGTVAGQDSSDAATADAPPPVRSLLDRWYLRRADPDGETARKGGLNARPDGEPAEPAGPDRPRTGVSIEELDFTDEFERPAGAVPPGEDEAVSGESDADAIFVFETDGEPVRFAWTVDSDCVFRSVSPELSRTVGPNAADIVGRHWRDIANVFGFDRTGEIEALMRKRDTWSGKSVLWPVQGTDLAVPVDLAALPAFGSSREFDGFRGFGIIRAADAIVDPEETGQALAGSGSQPPTVVPPADRDVESRRIERVSKLDDPEDDGRPDAGARSADIVDLTRRRAKNGNAGTGDDRLSGYEARAFAEIGRKLGARRESGDEAAAPGASGPRQARPAASLTRLEDLPWPAIMFDGTRLIAANARMLELTGYATVEELRGAGGLEGLFATGQSTGEAAAGISLSSSRGDAIPVSPKLQSVRTDEGTALVLSFPPDDGEPQPSALDVTRVSELQSILDTATDGIIVATADGRIESVNASAEALFGVSAHEVAGEPLTRLFAQESHKPVDDYMAEIGQPGVAGILNDGREVIGLEVNGGLIPLFITIGRIGETDKRCVVLRDITQWKKAEEELVGARRAAEAASEQKTEFLARVSHEIRTPLNAIIGFSDVMIEERFGAVENDRYREYLRDINRSGVHVLDLINDLLDISKIEAGKMELSYEAVDLNQIVSETVALLQPQANGERIIIRTSLSRAVPRVVADVRSMRQIILNLVSNAIKFTPMNGQVIVSTVYEGNGEVVLRVRDTGRGMSEKEVEHAMKPFSQINVTDEKRGQGTGLGLPLTKALVEANRAYFDLDSTPGEGTIAHVHFPTQRVLAD